MSLEETKQEDPIRPSTPHEDFLIRRDALRQQLPPHWFYDPIAMEKVRLFIMETFIQIPGVTREHMNYFAYWCLAQSSALMLSEMMASYEGFIKAVGKCFPGALSV